MSNLKQPLGVSDFLAQSANRYSLKTACIFEEEHYTYAYIYGQALGFAGGLRRKGIEKGDRVVIFMENSVQTIISIFGTLLANGVFSVVNSQTKAEKLNYILKDSDASFLVSTDSFFEVYDEAVQNIETLKNIISVGKTDYQITQQDNLVLEFNDFVISGVDNYESFRHVPTDLAALIYTSGSTGEPKGVMMSHQSMVFMTQCLDEYLKLSHHDRILNFLPLAFDYGLYQVFMSFSLGATLILEKNFVYPAKVINTVVREGVTVFPGVPTVYKTLLSISKRNKLVFKNVKKVTNTAAALSEELVPHLGRLFPSAEIYKMYGQTECKRICYLEPNKLREIPSSVGKALPGTEVFLLSPEGGPVEPGKRGILHVKGPHLMMGYWKKPEETKRTLRDGSLQGQKVLCTHDWFTMDEDGFLYFKGRNDEIINTRGEKVSPVEVENCLDGIKGVVDSAVIGEVDSLWGEAVVSFVVLDKTCDLTEKDIRRICMKKLESHMVPKKIYLVDELPMTTSGKVRKKGLERTYNKGEYVVRND